jgi:hypothetical protein
MPLPKTRHRSLGHQANQTGSLPLADRPTIQICGTQEMKSSHPSRFRQASRRALRRQTAATSPALPPTRRGRSLAVPTRGLMTAGRRGRFSWGHSPLAADAARQRLAARVANVRDCFVRRVPQGSVLLVGRFSGPSDPAAQAKLKELKALVVDGQRPFATAMLTRVSTDAEPPGPYDVRRLRERFPKVRPLYSLQVAAWSTFGEKGASRAEMRLAANTYCKELRAKNIEAWVHHDDDSGTSVVTVGHFDQSAYDSKSTLFSADVERLKKKFPRHLVNGEEVLIPVDPRKPDGQKRAQGCQLVEIPLF